MIECRRIETAAIAVLRSRRQACVTPSTPVVPWSPDRLGYLKACALTSRRDAEYAEIAEHSPLLNCTQGRQREQNSYAFFDFGQTHLWQVKCMCLAREANVYEE